MYDLIYHKGLVVAHVNLGSVFHRDDKGQNRDLERGQDFLAVGTVPRLDENCRQSILGEIAISCILESPRS